jgi:hypothetical protein
VVYKAVFANVLLFRKGDDFLLLDKLKRFNNMNMQKVKTNMTTFKKIIHAVMVLIYLAATGACAEIRSSNEQETMATTDNGALAGHRYRVVVSTDIVGWAKKSGYHNNNSVKQDEWERIKKYVIGAAFDNDSTLTEMKFIASHSYDKK